jgi:D-specific alpha-keto acid dehydrogenase
MPLTADMTSRESASMTQPRHHSADESGEPVPRTGITIFGCDAEEAALFREVASRLGVTTTSVTAAVSEANVDLTSGSRCISVDHKTQVSFSVLAALRDVGVSYLSTRSIGYNHIDVDSARRLGISVENVEYSPDSVGDFTLMLILMVLRNMKSTVVRGQQHDYRPLDLRGRELRDLTVGVIGTGHIGKAVIDRLSGFGCRVLAYDRCPKTSAEYVSLGALLQRSDVVTLHTPLTSDTHHLLDDRRIEEMRKGAIVVNTARGGLIDTEALLAALDDGRLGGAALDVVEGEEGVFYSDRTGTLAETSLFSRLQRLPNVVITPHTAYYTHHSLRDVVEQTLANCLRFEEGAAWVV